MVKNNIERKKEEYCRCNGCKTKRYQGLTMVFSLFVAIGVWVSFIF